jgi:hypothetical protein
MCFSSNKILENFIPLEYVFNLFKDKYLQHKNLIKTALICLHKQYLLKYYLDLEETVSKIHSQYINYNLYGQFFKSIIRNYYYQHFEKYKTHTPYYKDMSKNCYLFNDLKTNNLLMWLISALDCTYVHCNDIKIVMAKSYETFLVEKTNSDSAFALDELNKM